MSSFESVTITPATDRRPLGDPDDARIRKAIDRILEVSVIARAVSRCVFGKLFWRYVDKAVASTELAHSFVDRVVSVVTRFVLAVL